MRGRVGGESSTQGLSGYESVAENLFICIACLSWVVFLSLFCFSFYCNLALLLMMIILLCLNS